MCSWDDHASGMSIMNEWAIDRPDWISSSKALSICVESDPASSMIGLIFSVSDPNRSLRSVASRARIQLALPRTVLISPLWAR